MLYFGRDFLCGLDPPVLKLKFIAPSLSEYVSVVEQAAGTSAHNIPNRDPFNRQSYSSDDFDWNQPVSPLLKIYLLKKKIFFFFVFSFYSHCCSTFQMTLMVLMVLMVLGRVSEVVVVVVWGGEVEELKLELTTVLPVFTSQRP